MTKYLIFSDTHISTKGEFSEQRSDGLTGYLYRTKQSLDFIIDCVSKHTPDTVVFGGDLFESTGYIDTSSLQVATDFFNMLSNCCLVSPFESIFLVGNHDSFSLEHSIHNLSFLGLTLLNPHIVNEPKVIELKNGDKAFCLPWVKDSSTVEIPRCDICFAHTDIIGLAYPSGAKTEHGIDRTKFMIPTFNGHYHNPQVVTPLLSNVGALLSRDFRDVDSPVRGACLVTLTGKYVGPQIKFLPNPYDIPFTDIVIDDSTHRKWEETLATGKLGIEHCFVRIRYDNHYRELAETIGCLTMGARLEVISKKVVLKETAVNQSFAPEDNLKAYIEETFMFDEEGDDKRIHKLGAKYLEKAQASIKTNSHSIRLNKLTAKQFQSLGDVTLDLGEPGLVFVEGANKDDPSSSNASGKSSIQESIYWCLTGQSLRGYTGDEVIQWGKDFCFVSLDLTVGNSQYEIHRSRGPKGVRLIQQGTDISCRLDKDTEEKIQELLGRSKAVLRHSVFLTADLQTRFTALSFPDRVRLIEQVTGSEVYAETALLINSDLKEANQQLYKTQSAIDAATKLLLQLGGQLQHINGEISEARRKTDSEIATIKEHLGELIYDRDTTKAETDKLRASYDEYTAKTEESGAKTIDFNSALSDLEVRKATSVSRIDSIAHELADKRKLIADGKCPTCFQAIRNEQSPLTETIPVLTNELAVLKKQVKDFDSQIASAKKCIHDNNTLWNICRAKLGESKAAWSIAASSYQRLCSEVERTKQMLQQVKTSTVGLEARRDEIKRIISEQQTELTSKEIEIKTAGIAVNDLEYLSKAFGTDGIRAKVLSSVALPFINERLEEYSNKLGLPCQLNSQRETKGKEVQDKVDVDLSSDRTYRGCSRGEKRRVDLAIQLALNDLAIATGGGNINLLVADEVIDSLDQQGTQALIEVLSKKAESMTILLISHKPHLEHEFKRRWIVTKKDGVSSLKVS